MAERPALAALAERTGILSEFVDVGGSRRRTSDQTRAALLEAMGFDVSTEAAAKRALRALDAERESEPAPRVAVVASEPDRPVERVTLPGLKRLEPDAPLELVTETGERYPVELRASRRGARLRFPTPVGHGYHRLEGAVRSGGRRHEIDTSLILAPSSCHTIGELQGDRRSFGFWTNLYSVRSRRNRGIGDLGDLRELVAWTHQVGGWFIGINPLHATLNRGRDVSPYSPVSRLFRNPLYLELEAIPELESCREARDRIASAEYRRQAESLRSADRLDYERAMEIVRPVLRALHRCFAERHRDGATQRGRAYARYLERKGAALEGFATFMALREHLGERGAGDPREWPNEYLGPEKESVRRFRREHAEEIDFQCYLQFEMSRQLETIESAARDAGMPIGVYADLAIGTSPRGSDRWIFPELFVDGAHIGAPPDEYSAAGQDWGLPPIDPRELIRGRYDYWIRLVRNALESAGALRIDHVMGLFRQYWVPAARPATEGAYVRYPADDLLGILALESRRHGALIIGEDLGTVPPEVPPALGRWGILSSTVLYFERDEKGEFRAAADYSPHALVTTTTHDHPPLRGYWEGRDLEIRRRTGEIESDRELESAREERGRERAALLRRLRAERVLSRTGEPDYPTLCAAVHAFLARTPARLLGMSLDDLSGELDPVNMPGIGMDGYPNWQRRMGRELGDILADPAVHRTIESVAKVREPRP